MTGEYVCGVSGTFTAIFAVQIDKLAPTSEGALVPFFSV
jgi:hypothetical protein